MQYIYIDTYEYPNPDNGLWIDVILDGEILMPFSDMGDAREFVRKRYTMRDEAVPEREEYGDPVYNLLAYTETDEELGEIETVAVWRLADEGKVLDVHDDEVDFEAAVNAMDDGLREEIHMRGYECDQNFFDAYAEAHQHRFNEEWAPYWGKAW